MGNYIPHRPHDNRIISHLTNPLLCLCLRECGGVCARLLELCMFCLGLERPLTHFYTTGFSVGGEHVTFPQATTLAVSVSWSTAQHPVHITALLTKQSNITLL